VPEGVAADLAELDLVPREEDQHREAEFREAVDQSVHMGPAEDVGADQDAKQDAEQDAEQDLEDHERHGQPARRPVDRQRCQNGDQHDQNQCDPECDISGIYYRTPPGDGEEEWNLYP
jgi:hypothetical protein